MSSDIFSEILNGLYENKVVPYLGPGALFDATNELTGAAMPADSNSLILAMNNGNPMAPKLMYEFPRAAMNQELKKGRNFLGQFLTNYMAKQNGPVRQYTIGWLNGNPLMSSILIGIRNCRTVMPMKSIH